MHSDLGCDEAASVILSTSQQILSINSVLLSDEPTLSQLLGNASVFSTGLWISVELCRIVAHDVDMARSCVVATQGMQQGSLEETRLEKTHLEAERRSAYAASHMLSRFERACSSQKDSHLLRCCTHEYER